MRIAFVSTIFHYPWGGPDKRWTAMAEAARQRGDSVLLALAPRTADHPRVRALVADGAELWLRPRQSAYLGRLDEMRRKVPGLRGRFLETKLAKFRPDVVFLLQGGSYDILLEYHLIAWLVANRIPYLLSCSLSMPMAPLEARHMDAIKLAFGCASAVLFMSSANLRLAEEFLGAPLPQAEIVQNPLDFDLAGTVIGSPPPHARPRLGFIGRIDIEHKGLDLLLEALGNIKAEFEVDLDLTGPCDKPDEFGRLVAQHGLQGRVVLHGSAGPDGLRRAYEEAEMVVLTSRREGCASVMLEAMMAGRVQLVTPVGGVGDWLTDDRDAFIADEVSSTAVERALQRALANRERWPEMGRAAREAFGKRRDCDPVGKLMRILDRAAAGKPA